jgi:hypothetical protein
VIAGGVAYRAHERCWPAGVPTFDTDVVGAPLFIYQLPNEIVVVMQNGVGCMDATKKLATPHASVRKDEDATIFSCRPITRSGDRSGFGYGGLMLIRRAGDPSVNAAAVGAVPPPTAEGDVAIAGQCDRAALPSNSGRRCQPAFVPRRLDLPQNQVCISKPARCPNHDRSIGEEQQYLGNDIIHICPFRRSAGHSRQCRVGEPLGGRSIRSRQRRGSEWRCLWTPVAAPYLACDRTPKAASAFCGPAARSLRIRITCASYHRPPLGDGMLRSLRTTTAAAAGGAANSSKSGRNRAARSVAACKILCLMRPPESSGFTMSHLPVENEDQSSLWFFRTVAFLGMCLPAMR